MLLILMSDYKIDGKAFNWEKKKKKFMDYASILLIVYQGVQEITWRQIWQLLNYFSCLKSIIVIARTYFT